ncbi:Uncharacterised protein g6411 [Pycnogonum litorale]
MSENGVVQQKDTTFTKIFVGGLPYHTTDKSLREFFERFGEIEEAVVITDRQSGKSRGYGFVTMVDKDAADRACKDANPTIDGRKANVNLAYLGAKPRGNSIQYPYHYATRPGYPTILPSHYGLPPGYLYPSPYISAAAAAAAASSSVIIPQHGSLPPALAAAAQIYDYPTAAAFTSQYGSGFDYSPYSASPGPHATNPAHHTAAHHHTSGYITPTYAAGHYTIPQGLTAGQAAPAYAALPPYAAQPQDTRLQ